MSNHLIETDKKVWRSPEGVEIEMISYRTSRVDRIRERLTAFLLPGGAMGDTLAAFILSAASTLAVHLPVNEQAPRWATWLHRIVNTPHWQAEIARHYEETDFAPSDMLNLWYEAYLATRDRSLEAEPELQAPEPQAPTPNPETGEVDTDALNFTDSSTPDGTKSSPIVSLEQPKKPPVARVRAR